MLKLFLLLVCFQVACCNLLAHNTHCDTTVLYRIDTIVKVNSFPFSIQIDVPKNARVKTAVSQRKLLLFKGVTLLQMPAGVYEVYITARPPGKQQLSTNQPSFVSLLDLYRLTAPGNDASVSMDITSQLNAVLQHSSHPRACFITLRFSGIQLPDGTASREHGSLELKGIQIIQTGN